MCDYVLFGVCVWRVRQGLVSGVRLGCAVVGGVDRVLLCHLRSQWLCVWVCVCVGMCVCVCVRVGVRACVRAGVCVCV